MGVIEKLLVSLVLRILDRLGEYLFSKAADWKSHADDLGESTDAARKVESAAKKIRANIKTGKKVTKEFADELKERNTKLRSGGLFN